MPNGSLVTDKQGSIYGVAFCGGANDWGLVYKMTNSGGVWTETDLFDFGVGDAGQPLSGLIMDSTGVIYGIAAVGFPFAYYSETIYSLTPPTDGRTTWTYRSLYSAGSVDEGQIGFSGLLIGSDGALYSGQYTYDPSQTGEQKYSQTLFKIENNPARTLKYLWQGTGTDVPWAISGMAFDERGNLLGTSITGFAGAGAVWKLALSQTGIKPELSVLCSGNYDGLSIDSAGTMYSQTATDNEDLSNAIVALALPPVGQTQCIPTVLQVFSNRNGAGRFDFSVANPHKANVSLLGLTSGTRKYGEGPGLLWTLKSTGFAGAWQQSVLYEFNGRNSGGKHPSGLIPVPGGGPRAFYGTTNDGGVHGEGQLFLLH